MDRDTDVSFSAAPGDTASTRDPVLAGPAAAPHAPHAPPWLYGPLPLDILRLFVERVPAAVALVDTEMRYILHSRRWLADFGLDGQRLAGRSHYDVFPDLPERWKAAHRRCLAGSPQRVEEDRFDRADGTCIWLSWDIVPWRRPDGGVGGLLMFSEAITVEKMREQALAEYARQLAELSETGRIDRIRAVQASEAKASFLAAMGHELRTPLNAIIGFAELMANQIMGPLGNAKYAEYSDHIATGGRQLLKLLDDILDLSRIDIGNYILEKEVVDLAPLVRDCAAMMRSMALEKHQTLTVSAAVGRRVYADPRALRQVLVNLISNAVKYTPDRGDIRVRLSGDDTVVIEVRDTGVGMSAETIKAAFEPFVRVQPPFIASEGGLGVGLPLARHLVELHGGTIAIDSMPGQGTTVIVALPVHGP
jgi:hypothetical protein